MNQLTLKFNLFWPACPWSFCELLLQFFPSFSPGIPCIYKVDTSPCHYSIPLPTLHILLANGLPPLINTFPFSYDADWLSGSLHSLEKHICNELDPFRQSMPLVAHWLLTAVHSRDLPEVISSECCTIMSQWMDEIIVLFLFCYYFLASVCEFLLYLCQPCHQDIRACHVSAYDCTG